MHRIWPYFNQNISRSFLSVSLTRKYIFTALVIIYGQQDGPDAVVLLFFLQTFYLAYLALVRPFRSITDNIIEISLESIYFIILNLVLIETQSSKSLGWQKVFPYILLWLCLSKFSNFHSFHIVWIFIEVLQYLCNAILSWFMRRHKFTKSHITANDNSDIMANESKDMYNSRNRIIINEYIHKEDEKVSNSYIFYHSQKTIYKMVSIIFNIFMTKTQ